MIVVSKRVEYSLAFISYLARNKGKMLSLRQVAEGLNLPYRFLAQLVMKLKKEGMVTSREGKGGGYKLAGGWGEKSVYDLLEALGENRRMASCLSSGGSCCREKECKIKKIWVRLETSLTSELKKIKLKEI